MSKFDPLQLFKSAFDKYREEIVLGLKILVIASFIVTLMFLLTPSHAEVVKLKQLDCHSLSQLGQTPPSANITAGDYFVIPYGTDFFCNISFQKISVENFSDCFFNLAIRNFNSSNFSSTPKKLLDKFNSNQNISQIFTITGGFPKIGHYTDTLNLICNDKPVISHDIEFVVVERLPQDITVKISMIAIVEAIIGSIIATISNVIDIKGKIKGKKNRKWRITYILLSITIFVAPPIIIWFYF